MSLGQWSGASVLGGQAECRSRPERVEMLSTEARETTKHHSDSGEPLPTCGTGAGQS